MTIRLYSAEAQLTQRCFSGREECAAALSTAHRLSITNVSNLFVGESKSSKQAYYNNFTHFLKGNASGSAKSITSDRSGGG